MRTGRKERTIREATSSHEAEDRRRPERVISGRVVMGGCIPRCDRANQDDA